MKFLLLLLFILLLKVRCRDGLWTWINGSPSDNKETILFSQRGIPHIQNTPGLVDSHNIYIVNNFVYTVFGNMYVTTAKLFGNSMWRYNIDTNEWTNLQNEDYLVLSGNLDPSNYQKYNISNLPGAKRYASGSNVQRKVGTDVELFHFGGYGACVIGNPGPSDVSELWSFSVEREMWKLIRYDERSPSTLYVNKTKFGFGYPGGRFFSIMFLFENSSYIFGGSVLAGKLNDVWEYSFDLDQWRWVSGDSSVDMGSSVSPFLKYDPANKPSSRSGFVGWKVGNDSFMIYGGEAEDVSSRLWEFNITIEQWRRRLEGLPTQWCDGIDYSPNTSPGGLYEARAVKMNEDEFFIIGGSEMNEWERLN